MRKTKFLLVLFSIVFILTFILTFGILLISSVNWFYQGCEQYQYYSGILGSLLIAVFTALLVGVAWGQLGKLSMTSSADFLHRLKKDFFTDETRTLVSLIDCGALKFKGPIDKPNDEGESRDDIEALTYFVVDQSKINKTNYPKDLIQRLSRRKSYSTEEVDDLLLGHFEDIGMLERRGIVDFQMVYDTFSWYFETVWDDCHIKNYLRSQREGKEAARIDTVVYSQFQYIVIKCREYEALHPGPCIWWWRFKRFFCRPKIEIKI